MLSLRFDELNEKERSRLANDKGNEDEAVEVALKIIRPMIKEMKMML
jgi:hypothetical protein